MSSSFSKNVVVLGTGGTIAGLNAGENQALGYDAAQLGVGEIAQQAQVLELLNGMHWGLKSEQVAQIDSKDMDRGVWYALCMRCLVHLNDPEVAALVITHGTDTMAETAYLLSRLFAKASKPLVLTGAMKAHNDPLADGPRNFRDAVDLATRAAKAQRSGVWVVFDGVVHDPLRVKKFSAQSLNAFHSFEDDHLKANMAPQRILKNGLSAPSFDPFHDPMAWASWTFDASIAVHAWPHVEVLTCHADMAKGYFLDYLIDLKINKNHIDRDKSLSGLVISGMGSGTWPKVLEPALWRLLDLGLPMVLCSQVPWGQERAAKGAMLEHEHFFFSTLEPQKARIALMLHVLALSSGESKTPSF
jgi:L-asparaginase